MASQVPLTEQEAKFVDGVVRGKTYTDAALEAYNCKDRVSAGNLGSEVASRPKVQLAIKRGQRIEMSLDDIIAGLEEIAKYGGKVVQLRALELLLEQKGHKIAPIANTVTDSTDEVSVAEWESKLADLPLEILEGK